MTLRLLQMIASALVLAAGLMAAPAQAQTPFTVAGIEIDATADNAAEAQRRAMSEGQVRGAQRLIARMTLPEDRAAAGLGPISAEDAAGLIAGLRMSNEQRSATRYRGDLTLQFDPRAVRDYFARRSVPYVESQASPVLVVPVLEGEGGDSLWSGAWHEAWRTGGFQNALTPFIGLGSRQGAGGEPLGLGLISADDARRTDEAALRALADVYGVNAVAVVLARAGGGQVRTVGVVLNFGPDGTTREEMTAVAGAGDFREAARRIVERREEDWKRRSVVRGGEAAELEITILFSTLTEWRTLQAAVAGASLVQAARLDALSRSGAAMVLSHRGAREQLAAELDARGARLQRDPDLGWTVRSRR